MIPPTFFPELPQEVREMWLDPIAERYGWPFQSLDDSTDGTKWRYVLDLMTLHDLNDLRWHLEDVDIAAKPFRPGSLDAVEGLLQQHAMGKTTLYANLERTEERFRACASYVRDHGTIPAPLVLHEVDGVVQILDGNHRLAAVCFVSKIPDMSVDAKLPAWVGRKTKKAQQAGAPNPIPDSNQAFHSSPPFPCSDAP